MSYYLHFLHRSLQSGEEWEEGGDTPAPAPMSAVHSDPSESDRQYQAWA